MQVLRFVLPLCFLLLLQRETIPAQWIQTNGPYGGIVLSMAVAPNGMGGTNLYAGTYRSGIFLSTNDGTSWTAVSSGLGMHTDIYALAAFSNGSGGTNLFIGTGGGGAFLSTDNGTSWIASGLANYGVTSFAVTPNGAGGSNVFAGTGYGIFLSTDNGTSWAESDTGLADISVRCFAVTPNGAGGTNVFAGTDYHGVFLSTDGGTHWSPIGLADLGILSFAVSTNGSDSTNLFVGTAQGFVFLSTDSGTSWEEADSGLTSAAVVALAVSPSSGANLFAGTMSSGVFLSSNNGTSWTAVDSGLTNTRVMSLAVYPNGAGGTNLFAGTEIGGVFLSTDNGTSWTAVNGGVTNDVRSLAISSDGAGGANLFAGTNSGGVYRSTNSGISWTDLDPRFPDTYVCALVVVSNRAGGMNLLAGANGGGVLLSTNNGTSWTRVGASSVVHSLVAAPDGAGGTNLFAGCDGQGVFLSTDYGSTWTLVNSGLTSMSIHILGVTPNGAGGANLYVATSDGVFLSTDNGTSWNPSSLTDRYVSSFAVSYSGTGDTTLIAGTDDGFYFLSTDNGTGWTGISSDLAWAGILSFAVSPNGAGGTNLFAGTYRGSVFLSTDNGTRWTDVNPGLPFTNAYSLVVSPGGASDTDLFAGTDRGVWRWPLSQVSNYSAIDLTAADIADTALIAGTGRGAVKRPLPEKAPSLPHNLAATPGSGQILLHWSKDNHPNFLRYRVYGDTLPNRRTLIDSATGGATDTTKVIQGLVKGRTYYFRVTAADGRGFNNDFSNEVAAAPGVSMHLTAIPGIRGVLLHWGKDSHGDFMRYRIYGDTLPTPATPLDSTIGGVTDTTKAIYGLANGATYHFRLTAVNSSGMENDWSNEVTARPGLFLPTLIAIPGDGQVLLRWGKDNHPDFVRYRIYGDTVPHPTAQIDSTSGGATDTTKVIHGLTNNTTYFFRLTAAGSAGFESEWSNEVATIPGPFVFLVNNGWNMVSVPSRVADHRTSSLFPFAVSSAFSYEGAYAINDTLANGIGYWLKFSGSRYVSVGGSPLTDDTVHVHTGWNIIGSLTAPIPVGGIASIPGGIETSQFFGYTSAYTPCDSILPGNGYWLKVAQDGMLILTSSPGAVSASQRIRIVPTEESPPAAPGEKNPERALPVAYALQQNYPNPFNPATMIRYDLPTSSHVRLTVYDILGREVSTLVDGVQEPGYRSVTFTAQGLTSGVYYYRLQAGTYTATKKLLLLR